MAEQDGEEGKSRCGSAKDAVCNKDREEVTQSRREGQCPRINLCRILMGFSLRARAGGAHCRVECLEALSRRESFKGA